MKINPLLFSPSPRDIPAVLELWETLEYDHVIEKYKMPLDAYQDARKFFLDHEEYTHLVVCPDDLEVTQTALNMLVSDIMVHKYPVISGMCNMEESQPDKFNIQKTGISYEENHPPMGKKAWMRMEDMPKEYIFEVGFAGFACEFIERSVVEQVSLRGDAHDGQSNMDWGFTKECVKLGIKIMVDRRVNLWHRRKEQYHQAKAVKSKGAHSEDSKEILVRRRI